MIPCKARRVRSLTTLAEALPAIAAVGCVAGLLWAVPLRFGQQMCFLHSQYFCLLLVASSVAALVVVAIAAAVSPVPLT